MFQFSIGDIDFEWNGSYTVNVFVGGYNTDVFSLDYGRSDLSEADAMLAALDWMKYAEEIDV